MAKTYTQGTRKMTLAQQIATDLIAEHNSFEKALAAAKTQVGKMDSTNAHLWHWSKAIDLLDERTQS